ncbi:MAG: UDP-N-acetylmuramoyl-tripeptide--D-alanyl-D-alanine ligase [Deltaproteobacteria bacterium]|nr:MAG: UDP-N-acetylmuramoyl-tripeptide--D-alanyl-D-alanine ligase [Deltaproteobacteria bacterium]
MPLMTAHFSIPDLITATRGQLHQPGSWPHLVGISTDSRTSQSGQLFIALQGENHDGHDFIGKALARGVAGLLVAEAWWRSHPRLVPPEVMVIRVPDTLTALGDLAQAWRRRFSLPVVALTGSCGKTTTKEMAAQVAQVAYRVLKNEMNFNNLIGLPQTLLALNATHQVAVVEMGMNHFGEIRRLTQIAAPTIGVLTNIYPAHTEGVGDVEGVARAKAELLEGLAANQLLIYNQDDPRVARLAQWFPGRTLSFGLSAPAQVRAFNHRSHGIAGQEVKISFPGQTCSVFLRISGLHHLYNSLAAAAVGLALGLSAPQIVAGLENFRPLDKRTQLITLKSGVHIINDSYNANPGSMAMALRTLADLKNQGRAVAVLGDMLELGAGAIQAHQELGEQAGRYKLDLLVTCGAYGELVAEAARAAGMSARQACAVPSHAEGAKILKGFLQPGDWLLVKGSRAMRMENLIKALET